MGLPTTIKLRHGQWVTLPGTNVQVLLRGKYRPRCDAVTIVRDEHAWQLDTVRDMILVRKCDLAGNPVTAAWPVLPPGESTG